MVVVERRLRRGGKLLSQTAMTTEQPIPEQRLLFGMVGEKYRLPPHVRKRLQQIRQDDKNPDVHKTSFGDYFGFGGASFGDLYTANEHNELSNYHDKRRTSGNWLLRLFNIRV